MFTLMDWIRHFAATYALYTIISKFFPELY